MHYTCIAYITNDSVMRMENKNHLQVYLKECKYRIKKIQISRFINTELKSESEPGSESESDTELMAKLESACDSDKRLYFRQCFNNTFLLTFNKSKKSNSHFSGFEQVKKIAILLTFNKLKLKTTKLPWKKLDA